MAKLSWRPKTRTELTAGLTQSFHEPKDLVRALHSRSDSAKRDLRSWLQQPLGKLIDELTARYRLDPSPELQSRTYHTLEIYLLTRPEKLFATMSWEAFRNTLLLQSARLLSMPFGQQPSQAPGGPGPLPASNGYDSRAFYRPFEKVGEHLFGGDWYAGLHAHDGALWVIVADVTGHGYHAYLLASALPDLWETCWRAMTPGCQPAQVLEKMHEMIEGSLPDGIYIEGVVLRLDDDGKVSVMTAGGSKLLLKRTEAEPELIKLRGAWLGLAEPTHNEQRNWQLERGDELVLATDGLYDQLDDRLDEALAKATWNKEQSLFGFCQRILEEALADEAQHDDITMLQLIRRPFGVVSAPEAVDSHSV